MSKKKLYILVIILAAILLWKIGSEYFERRKDYSDIKYHVISSNSGYGDDLSSCYFKIMFSRNNLKQLNKSNPELYKQFLFCMAQRSIEEYKMEKTRIFFELYDLHYKDGIYFNNIQMIRNSDNDVVIKNNMVNKNYGNLILTKEDWYAFEQEDCKCRWKTQNAFVEISYEEVLFD